MMPLRTTECDTLITSINHALPNENHDITPVLLHKEKWTWEEASTALMGSDDVPAIFHDAATFLSKYTFPFSRDENTHVMPKPFLLWCREQGILLRKQLSIWLDADDNKEFACLEIDWSVWAHPYRDCWSIGVLACLLANVPPVIEITYILHHYPEKTAFALGCSITQATQIVNSYKQFFNTIENKEIPMFERVTMPNGKLRGISVFRPAIEAWMAENHMSMPYEFIIARAQILHTLESRREGNKQWINLVNGTDESRYSATSQPTSLKKGNHPYYENKLVPIGLVTFMLLDIPHKEYDRKETEQRLYEEWEKGFANYTDYPWAHLIYGALREATLLGEIPLIEMNTYEEEESTTYKLYEVSLTSALSWCREQGVMLDGLMLAHIGEVKNILPEISSDTSQQTIRKQHTIERDKHIKLNAAEAYNNLRQRTSIHNITKNMIANELIKIGKSEGIKEIGTLLRLFSTDDYIPQKSSI